MDAGLSSTITHNAIIADRSEAGMLAIACILDVCPIADERITAWRQSTDGFFVFICENDGNRMASVTAIGLEHLLHGVLPELFAKLLNPPANPEFDIFVDDVMIRIIHDRIARLRISAALEEGNRH
jgi:hypothetical protein